MNNEGQFFFWFSRKFKLHVSNITKALNFIIKTNKINLKINNRQNKTINNNKNTIIHTTRVD